MTKLNNIFTGDNLFPRCGTILRRLSDKVMERLVDIKDDQFEARKDF